MTFFPGSTDHTYPFQKKGPYYNPVKGHTGQDYLMPESTPIKTPVSGEVVATYNQTEMGKTMYVKDSQNNIHVFAHLSEFVAKKGDKVRRNQLIAKSGNTGTKTDAPHLHYEIISPIPQKGLEHMTRSLRGFKGYNIDPEEFLTKQLNQEKMSQPRPKDDLEIIKELGTYLLILKEELEVLKDKPYRSRVVACVLRLLVADKTNEGGLLRRLIKKYSFEGKIKKWDKEVTLEEYLKHPFIKTSYDNGKSEVSKTRENIIADTAQQEGIAHCTLNRTESNFLFQAILSMGKSEKTDPQYAFWSETGGIVFEYGTKFMLKVVEDFVKQDEKQ